MKLSTAIRFAMIAVAVSLLLPITIAAWYDPLNTNDAISRPSDRPIQPVADIITAASKTYPAPEVTTVPNVVAVERRYMCCQTSCDAFAQKYLDRKCMLSGGKKAECWVWACTGSSKDEGARCQLCSQQEMSKGEPKQEWGWEKKPGLLGIEL